MEQTARELPQTSIDAYHYIKEHGILSARRFEVYDVLCESTGPLTHNEISVRVEQKYPKPAFYRNNTVARLSELRDLGLAREVGAAKDGVSGLMCTAWEAIRDHIPTPQAKGPGPFVQAKEAVQALAGNRLDMLRYVVEHELELDGDPTEAALRVSIARHATSLLTVTRKKGMGVIVTR